MATCGSIMFTGSLLNLSMDALGSYQLLPLLLEMMLNGEN